MSNKVGGSMAFSYCGKLFRDYANDTPVILIGRAADVKRSNFERSFWTVYACLMLGLTIFDLYTIFDNFLSERTSSEIVMMRNSSISFPNAYACVFFYPAGFRFGVNVSNASEVNELLDSYNEMDDILAYLGKELSLQSGKTLTLHPSNSESAVNRIVLHRLASGSQGLPETRQHDSLVYLTVAMLISIVRTESVIHHRRMSFNYTKWGLMSYNAALNVFDVDLSSVESVRAVYLFYLRRKVDFAELFKVTGAAFCSKLKFYIFARVEDRITLDLQYKFNDICHKEQLYWLGSNAMEERTTQPVICTRLPDDVIQFRNDGDYVQFGYIHHSIYANYNMPFWRDQSYLELAEGDNSNDFTLSPLQSVNTKVFIDGHYKAISTKSSPCSTIIEKSSCRHTCRTQYIVRHCGCFPLSQVPFRDSNSQVPVCGQIPIEAIAQHGNNVPLRNTTACRRILENLDPDLECSAKCVDHCEVTIAGFEFVEPTTPDYPFLNATTLTIQMERFLYPEIRQSLAMDSRSFSASIGGVTSLWLGISLIGVVHMIVFCLKTPVEHFQKKRAEKESSAQTDNNAAACELLDLGSCLEAANADPKLAKQSNELDNQRNYELEANENHQKRSVVEDTIWTRL